ncbi:MAG TPA: PEGA domain-containing protein, partial [Polyangia bacterium]|nr:PEGA domain-containing protein [Polyangia bacterium]
DKPAPDKPAAAPVADKPAAEKPAADQPAPDKPAEAAAGDKPAAAPPAPPPPVVKITSTPSGALILIDGKEVGTTPFLSKEIDPASPHAITIKKDGYEPAERMVSGLDWSRPKGNNPQTLKVNAKLRRSTPAAPASTGAAPAAPKDTGDQKGNGEPEDTGGPYIKEVKPDSP